MNCVYEFKHTLKSMTYKLSSIKSGDISHLQKHPLITNRINDLQEPLYEPLYGRVHFTLEIGKIAQILCFHR